MPTCTEKVIRDLTNLVDGGVQVVIDIYKGVRPQPLLQFLAGHHLSGALQQDGEHLKGMSCQSHLQPALAQFSRWKVNFEGSEPD
jgi:hypothetical protein